MRKWLYVLGILFCLFSRLSAQETPSFLLPQSVLKKSSLYQSPDYEVILDKSSLSFFVPDSAKRDTLKLRLKNGLEVYLISDSSVEQSSAALSVDVGSWDDPEQFPGMAHFVEHLLFMGTKAFPSESEYTQYIMERGGEYNAATEHGRTIYGFCIDEENLEGALQRFSHFFIDPLFLPSTIEREMHAVDHEFEDHIENDVLRIWRILKETGNPHHPNAVFSCGNLHSLSSITDKDIKEWFYSHYLAHSMHLVVISSLPLSEQVSFVVENFSQIRNEEKQKPSFSASMTSERQKGHMIHVTPSYKNRSLQLIWEVPQEFAHNYSKRAMDLVQMALDHEGNHSLGKILESEQLAHEMAIDFWRVEKDHALFLIEVALTKKGVREVDTVIFRCFQAISKLKETGIPSYLFDQLYESEKSLAEYSSPHNSFDFIMNMAGEMVYEELETYPEKTYIPSPFDSDFTLKFIHSLDPQSCLFFLVAPPGESGIRSNAIEKWMGSSYVIRSIPNEKLEAWKEAPPHPFLEIRGEVLEEEKTQTIILHEDEEENEETVVIVDDDMAHIQWVFNEDINMNGVGAFFCLTSPYFNTSLKNAALSTVFLSFLRERFASLFPQEQKDLLYWFLVPGESELCIALKMERPGIKKKLHHFFSAFKDLQLNEEAFNRHRQTCMEADCGDPSPLEHAQLVAQSFLMPSFYTKGEIFQKIPSITYKDFVEFSHHFFDKVHIEGFFYGHLAEDQAISYWEQIKQSLHSEAYIFEEEDPSLFPFAPLEGPFYVEQRTHRKGNALILLIETGEATKERWVAQKVLCMLLQQEFFEELRTKQQTAYRLYTWDDNHRDTLLQYFAIQSSTHHPRDLYCRVEGFLEEFVENFSTKISSERVEIVRQMLIATLKREMQSIESKEDSKWAQSVLEALKALDYEKVTEFVKDFFSIQNKKRLAILIEGSGANRDFAFEEKKSHHYIQRQ